MLATGRKPAGILVGSERSQFILVEQVLGLFQSQLQCLDPPYIGQTLKRSNGAKAHGENFRVNKKTSAWAWGQTAPAGMACFMAVYCDQPSGVEGGSAG